MQNLIIFLLSIVIFGGCTPEPDDPTPNQAVRDALADIRRTHAPDARTERVTVEVTEEGSPTALTGYTTVPAAWQRLDSLAAISPDLSNRVRLLGQADSFGLIRVSVANIRTRPGHSQELTSQALMGTPVAILLESEGWCLIRTPDRYLAWLETGAISRMDRAGVERWFSDSLRTCVPAQSEVRRGPASDRIVSELVAGNVVRITGAVIGNYSEVSLPDGRTGYVKTQDLEPFAELARPGGLPTEALLNTAYAQTGRPYLWGGTSPKGMDCSGFTKTAYYLNGYVIPRDASQQVRAGIEVPLDEEFSQLRRGDLLFFGNYREDGSERTTHVGFYLGEGRILHAGADNGYITENSLLPDEVDYAPHRRESLLRARRLVPGTEAVVPVGEAFRSLYTKSSSR